MHTKAQPATVSRLLYFFVAIGLVAVTAPQVTFGAPPQRPLHSAIANTSTGRLLGGSPVDFSTLAVGRVILGDGSCTGVLIAPNLVLTAGHCGMIEGEIFTLIGGELRAVRAVHVGPNFNPNGRVTPENERHDLAVLELVSPIEAVAPYFIVMDDTPAPGERYVVLGMGATEDPFGYTAPAVGQIGGITISAAGRGLLTSSTLYSPAVTCPGDSGAPLMRFTKDSRYGLVFGIVVAGTTTLDLAGSCIAPGYGQSLFIALQSHPSRELFSKFRSLALTTTSIVATYELAITARERIAAIHGDTVGTSTPFFSPRQGKKLKALANSLSRRLSKITLRRTTHRRTLLNALSRKLAALSVVSELTPSKRIATLLLATKRIADELIAMGLGIT